MIKNSIDVYNTIPAGENCTIQHNRQNSENDHVTVSVIDGKKRVLLYQHHDVDVISLTQVALGIAFNGVIEPIYELTHEVV